MIYDDKMSPQVIDKSAFIYDFQITKVMTGGF